MFSQLSSIVNPPPVEFDSNKFLIGFDDGVFDLLEWVRRDPETNELIHKPTDFHKAFRPYQPEDYMTISVGYKFPLEIDESKSIEMRAFMEAVFPVAEEREYCLATLAAGLDGVMYQKFVMWNGDGGNGKSKLLAVMAKVLGGYYYAPSNDILNCLGGANNATAGTLQLMNKRMLAFEEIGDGKPLNNEVINKLTGGDTPIPVRGLYSKNVINMLLECIIVSTFNNPPHFKRTPDGSDALRRYIYLYFRTLFTYDKELVGKTIYKNGIEQTYRMGDYKVDAAGWADSLKCVMLQTLLQVYQKYSAGTRGLKFPAFKCIEDATKKYLNNQNMFESVFNQLYIQTGNDKDILKRSVVSNTVRCHEDFSGERNNKQYSSKRFDEWLLKRVGRREFEIDGSKNKTQIIKGYKEAPRDDEYEDDDSDNDSGETTSCDSVHTMTPPAMPIVYRKK